LAMSPTGQAAISRIPKRRFSGKPKEDDTRRPSAGSKTICVRIAAETGTICLTSRY
jgi:hypothetical protein